MNVDEVEKAVKNLSPSDLADFSKWFEEFLAEIWDQRIEADIKSGRLNSLGKQADKDFETGNCSPL